jgi:hypothetical protein
MVASQAMARAHHAIAASADSTKYLIPRTCRIGRARDDRFHLSLITTRSQHAFQITWTADIDWMVSPRLLFLDAKFVPTV